MVPQPSLSGKRWNTEASTNFVLTVNAANTPPTITAIGPQSTNENTPTGAIAFTIGDAETPPSGLTFQVLLQMRH